MPRTKGAKNIKPQTTSDVPGILEKLRIVHDYHQHIVIMDVSAFVPYSAFYALDTIFSKIGLVIKRQFGYLGFCWGYGEMVEKRYNGSYGILEAPVSLHIYFQREIDQDFLTKREAQFATIYDYVRHEWELFKGIGDKSENI
jgi:hypothetical protein